MTIIGIGSDLVNIERIERIIKRYDKRFIERVFCKNEILDAQKKENSIAAYAKNFAAKEATLKALGTGLSQAITWQDVEVKRFLNGKPYIILKNKAYEYLQLILSTKYDATIHLTISDDYPWAQAFVVIESFSKYNTLTLIEEKIKKIYGGFIRPINNKYMN